MLLAIVCMIAPAAHHQLAERGESTPRQARFNKLMIGLSLAPFAAGIGLNIIVAADAELGPSLTMGLAIVAVLGALFLWYGIEIMVARPKPKPLDANSEPTSLKDKVTDLMTETRIVLPGVQALLGFQLAAYLTQAFAALPPEARIAHDTGLILLLTSMILLMTPAPFHRLAEDGMETERLCRLSRRLILISLASLGLALAADFYVAARVVTHSRTSAIVGGGCAAVCALLAWFVFPLLAAARNNRQPTPHPTGDARHA